MQASKTGVADDRVPTVVVAMRDLTPRIRWLRLERADGLPLPPYSAGAHIEIGLRLQGVDAPAHRAYSLLVPSGRIATAQADAQATVGYEIAVQLEPAGHGGSRWMHQLRIGDHVLTRGPRNQFALTPDAQGYLLLAGGIGITPILCMARELAAQGHRFELHYGARDRPGAAFCDEVEALGGRCWFDAGHPEQGLPLSALMAAPRAGTHLYVCGPRPLIADAFRHARAQGWSEAQLHCELFSGTTPVTGDSAFQVELRLSGLTLNVPANGTVMQAMEAAGLEPMFDCRRGECGVCIARVLEGEADHRDSCLSTSDRACGQFCTCVSRARSAALVLEL